MTANPWLQLPNRPPYVLPEDAEMVRRFNTGASEILKLRIDELLPEPVVGDPEAPVLLLSNNPGFGKYAGFRQQHAFMRKLRAGLGGRYADVPFLYLDPEFPEAGRWWRQKLKCLIDVLGEKVVGRSVCNVVFFPYPSIRFGHRRCELPSQAYAFGFVHQAVERGAAIVLMRKGRLKQWLDKVPSLIAYDKLVLLRNPQMPSISPKNCEEGDFEKIVDAIRQGKGRKSVPNRPKNG